MGNDDLCSIRDDRNDVYLIIDEKNIINMQDEGIYFQVNNDIFYY